MAFAEIPKLQGILISEELKECHVDSYKNALSVIFYSVSDILHFRGCH